MSAKRLTLFLALVFGFTGIAAPSLHAQGLPGNGCSDGDLNGKYVIGGSGRNVDLDLLGLIQFQQHVEDVGYLVFDGKGNISQGNIDEKVDSNATDVSVSGTYDILASCVGTITLDVNGATRNYSLLPAAVPGGMSSFTFFDSQSGTDIALEATRTFDPAGGCATNILYGDLGSGDGSGGAGGMAVSGITEIAFNSDGTFSLMGLGSDNGQISNEQITGTYAVASDCSVQLFQSGSSVEVGRIQLEFSQTGSPANALMQPAAANSNAPMPIGGDFLVTWEPASSSGLEGRFSSLQQSIL